MKNMSAIALLPLAVVSLSGCGPAATSPTAGSEKQIVYTVTGDAGKASVTYSTDGTGSTQQDSAAPLPWTHKMTLKPGVISVLTVVAQSQGDGKITCSISVDGKEVKTATSSGQFTIATCTTNIK